MKQVTLKIDPRWFQIFFQLVFLLYGLIFLQWSAEWLQWVIYVPGAIFLNYCASSLKAKVKLPMTGKNGFAQWGLSAAVSGLSLCLLLRFNHWYSGLLAVSLTVASKFLLRFEGRHIFNPSVFGILGTIALSGDAWISPGQWGSSIIFGFMAIVLGFIVVTRVQKLDVSLCFLIVFAALLFWRQVLFLGWPLDHFLHSLATGSLLLFSFFMISDPKTTPDHPLARIVWSVIVATIAFYMITFLWKPDALLWSLCMGAPLVPLFNHLFKKRAFIWKTAVFTIPFYQKIFKPRL